MAAPPIFTTIVTAAIIIFMNVMMMMSSVVAQPLGGQQQQGGGGSWCVARSDASNDALQTALDYACGAGADCFPLQPDGLCFLPNTIQAHASYAFNSYYQLKKRAPGSCDFAGTATIAQSDPSITPFPLPLPLPPPFYSFIYNVDYFVDLISFFIYIGYGSCVYPSAARYASVSVSQLDLMCCYCYIYIYGKWRRKWNDFCSVILKQMDSHSQI